MVNLLLGDIFLKLNSPCPTTTKLKFYSGTNQI